MGLTALAFLALLGVSWPSPGVPSQDASLIQKLIHSDEEGRLWAVQALAERHRAGQIGPGTEQHLRNLYAEPQTSADARIHIILYFGEVVRAADDDTTWIWLLEKYRSETDPGLKVALMHSLGEVGQVDPATVSPVSLLRHRRQYKATCAQKILNPQVPAKP